MNMATGLRCFMLYIKSRKGLRVTRSSRYAWPRPSSKPPACAPRGPRRRQEGATPARCRWRQSRQAALWSDARAVPALFQPHGKVRARPGPSGEALCVAAPCKRHGVDDATRSLRV